MGGGSSPQRRQDTHPISSLRHATWRNGEKRWKNPHASIVGISDVFDYYSLYDLRSGSPPGAMKTPCANKWRIDGAVTRFTDMSAIKRLAL
jgi:hypothetical protein